MEGIVKIQSQSVFTIFGTIKEKNGFFPSIKHCLPFLQHMKFDSPIAFHDKFIDNYRYIECILLQSYFSYMYN